MILYIQNLYTKIYKIYKIYQTYEIYSYFIIFIIIIYIYIYIYFFFIYLFIYFIPCNVSRNVHLQDCLEFHHLDFLIKRVATFGG
jgi:hypothetical protein